MAASQARFLGLTARMNNIEFEGQQINQQRTALANKSASYYSDLLGMSVPTAPSVENYTQTVYTFDDGALTNQITSLIADREHAGKYNVSYIKSWTDDFSVVSAQPSIITKINGGAEYQIGSVKLRELGAVSSEPHVGNSINIGGTSYTVYNDAGGYFYNQPKLVDKTETVTAGEIDWSNVEYWYVEGKNYSSNDPSIWHYVTPDGSGGFVAADGTDMTGITENDLIIDVFDISDNNPATATTFYEKNATGGTYTKYYSDYEDEKTYLTPAQVASITSASFDVGEDEYLKTLSSDQLSALLEEEQAYLKLLNQELNGGDESGRWYVRYVQNTATGEYEPVFYKQNDVQNANYSNNGNSQSFIGAYTIGSSERIEEVKGVGNCTLEQDSTGRYINITIPSADGMTTTTYALTTNTVTDQRAYDDAMNQYEYDKALYDKSIDDINSKIAIIQAEDKNLELRLKQLDTEHNAVSNEKDAVEKVIEKSVESGFKTFG